MLLLAVVLAALPGVATPSGNIHCFYVPAKPAHLLCDIHEASYNAREQDGCMARAGLDDDVVTTLSELARLCRSERDAVLVGLDLLGNADLHGGSPYLVHRSARLRRRYATDPRRFRR